MQTTMPGGAVEGAGSGLRVFSFGGGWQSTAALVLAAQGRLDFRTFVFANVGEDSEHPGTLAYIAEHARPFRRGARPGFGRGAPYEADGRR